MTADASRLRDGLALWALNVQSTAVDAVPDAVRPLAPLGVVSGDPNSSYVPGQLRESIAVDGAVVVAGPSFRGRVVAPVIQAQTTDQGSPPHPIEGNPLLRFHWANGPQGARIYTFRHVNHPGNPAQNWWDPAIRAAYADALLTAAVSVPFV